MAWDFETDPEYQKKLDWVAEFVREEIEPLDYVFPHKQFTPMTPTMRKIIRSEPKGSGPPTSARNSAAKASGS
jgi:hypothetical protein